MLPLSRSVVVSSRMAIIRPAQESDLPDAYDAFYQTEILGEPDPPPPGSSSELWHVFRTGKVYVAEIDGNIAGYAGAIARGIHDYLTDLFVQPGLQSSGLGKMLLDHVLPPVAGRVRSTISSNDHRAHGLYIRLGLRPLWPHYNLANRSARRESWPEQDVVMVETSLNDPELVTWDARLSGRERRADLEYWVREQRAVAFWFERRGRRVGYGLIRLSAATLWHPDSCEIGPLGVEHREDAVACVLAAVRWASDNAPRVMVNLPGPHPALAPVLDTGFRITYVETFHTTADAPFFDEHRYIASASTLL
jgi:GNAT superfamily N-acetyltransferase